MGLNPAPNHPEEGELRSEYILTLAFPWLAFSHLTSSDANMLSHYPMVSHTGETVMGLAVCLHRLGNPACLSHNPTCSGLTGQYPSSQSFRQLTKCPPRGSSSDHTWTPSQL